MNLICYLGAEDRNVNSYPSSHTQSNSASYLRQFHIMTTTTHTPMGISLFSDLVDLVANKLPVDLSTTMVLVFAQLGISDIPRDIRHGS